MDERVVQFRVGVMVLATLIITVILVVMFGQGTSRGLRSLLPGNKPYTVKIQFDEAPGVNENTPIRKSGIIIGRVLRVEFADEMQRKVLVEAEIDAGRKIFTDEECRLTRGVMGDSRLEIVPVKIARQTSNVAPSLPPAGYTARYAAAESSPAGPKPIEPGGTMRGHAAQDPMQVFEQLGGQADQAMASIRDTSDEIRRFVRSVNELMGGDETVPQRRMQLRELVDETRQTLRSIRAVADSANAMLGGGPEGNNEIRETLRKVPVLVDNLGKTLGRLDAGIEGMNETILSARKNLNNLEQFTGPLGAQGDQIIKNINQATSEVRDLTTRINNQQGSLGKLINDPSLYDNLNRATENIEELSRRLRPIVEDVRVFTDKLARDPGSIGVRGALQKNTPTKW